MSRMAPMHTNYVIGLGLGLLVLAVCGWWYVAEFTSGGEMATTTGDISTALGELVASGKTKITGNGFTIEVVPDTEGEVPTPPALERPIPPTPDLSAEDRVVVIGRFDATVAALKTNQKSFADWMDLGFLRYVVKDYIGAGAAWEYAALLGPDTTTPFANLGDLYTFYLKDYAKAETNLKKAIANDPSKSARFYRSLYELYTMWKPNTDMPAQTLKDGIKQTPDALDLHVLLARYYKEKGKTTESRAAYDAAISVATKAGNTEAVAQLRAERP